jgi:hypothetical protein
VDTTPDVWIKNVVPPGRRPLVVVQVARNSQRWLVATFRVVWFVGLFFSDFVLHHRSGVVKFALMLALGLPYLVAARWLAQRHAVGLVDDEVVVVEHFEWWRRRSDRMVGSWPASEVALDLVERPRPALMIANVPYWVGWGGIERARLLVNTVRTTRAL